MANPPMNLQTTTLTDTSNLGGPFSGWSARQTLSGVKSNEEATVRKLVVRAWNNPYATGSVNGKNRVVGPYRAVNNLGDFLSRVDYSCGGPNQVNNMKPGLARVIGSVPQMCDDSNIAPSSTNVRWVSDSSEYMRYKKQVAMVRNHNDLSNGGDEHNGSFVPLMRARR